MVSIGLAVTFGEAVSYVDGRPQSVFTIEVNDGRIRAIYIVTNPEKLSHLPPPPFQAAAAWMLP
jgi:hypothetical protein